MTSGRKNVLFSLAAKVSVAACIARDVMEFVRNLISRCNVPRRERNRCGSKPEKSLRPNTPEKYTDFFPSLFHSATTSVISNGHFPFAFIPRSVAFSLLSVFLLFPSRRFQEFPEYLPIRRIMKHSSAMLRHSARVYSNSPSFSPNEFEIFRKNREF